MKISKSTIDVLKNFSTINKSLLVRPGNTIKTISGKRSVYAKAVVEESFPTKFSIYELSRFLGAISLFEDPDFEFFDDHLKISEGRNFIRYAYADESMIVAPPDTDLTAPNIDYTIEISEKDLASITKAISLLQVPEVSIVGEDGNINIRAINNKNPSSDQFNIPVGVTDKTFNAIFKADYLKLLPGNYKINISNNGFAEFIGSDVLYWIAADADSNLGN